MLEIADLLHRECGKPMIEGVTETAAVLPQLTWAAGNDGLREFARSKAITARRAPSPLPAWTFERDPDTTARRLVTVMRLLCSRSRLPQPPNAVARFRR